MKRYCNRCGNVLYIVVPTGEFYCPECEIIKENQDEKSKEEFEVL